MADRLYPNTLLGTSVVSYHDLRRVHGDLGATIYARAVAENAVMPREYVARVEIYLRERFTSLSDTRREFIRWDFYNRYMNDHA